MMVSVALAMLCLVTNGVLAADKIVHDAEYY